MLLDSMPATTLYQKCRESQLQIFFSNQAEKPNIFGDIVKNAFS